MTTGFLTPTFPVMVRLLRPVAVALGPRPVEAGLGRGVALPFADAAIWLAVALVGLRFLPSIVWHVPWMVPDESIFLSGSIDYSPVVGPIAGVLGVAGYLTFNTVVAILVVLAAGQLAREWGGEPGTTAVLVALAPALFWGVLVMPDLVGALGIVAWSLSVTRARPWLGALVLVLAVGVDATLSIFALGWLVAALAFRSCRVPALAALAGSAVVSLVLIRLGGYTDVSHEGSQMTFAGTAITWGLISIGLVLLPLVPAFAYGMRLAPISRAPLLATGLGTFLAAGYVGAGSGLHAIARYGLPLAVLVLCCVSRVGYRPSPRMLVWGSLVVLAVGILTPADESEALWIAALLSPVAYGLLLALGGFVGWRGRPALGLALQSLVLVVVDLTNSADVRDGLSLAAQGLGRWSGIA